MFRKLILLVVGLVILNALLRAANTSPGLVVELVVSWLVCLYVVVRAWPGIMRDLARLRTRSLPRLRPIGRSGRGDTL
jgi:hypothetical protein